MVEVHLFADQIFTFEDKDQRSRNLHQVSRRLNPVPDASMRASKPALDDHRIFRVIDRTLLKIEIWKSSEQVTHESFDSLRTICYGLEGRDLVPRMPKRRQYAGYIVIDSLCLDMGLHNCFAPGTDT